MRFGLMQLVPGVTGRSANEIYRRNLEEVRLAEELGFSSVWVAEHHFTDYGMVSSTLQYLSAAAAMTDRIRLGAAVIVAPLHNPVRIAEEVAFLDALSNGRLDVGVGRGYQPREYSAFGLPIEESRERFDETIAFLRKAWTATEPFDWEGRFFSGREIYINPEVVQKPYPPLWMAAVSPPTFDLAGQAGWQIMTSPNFTPVPMVKDNFERYRTALVASGYEPSSFANPMMQQIYVGATDEAAYNEPQAACMSYFSKLSSLLPTEVKEGENPDNYRQFRKMKQRLDDMRYDYLFENSVMFGSPKQVIERIRFLHDELGVNYLIGWFNMAGLETKLIHDSMRRFAEEVIPAFADDEAPAADAAELASTERVG